MQSYLPVLLCLISGAVSAPAGALLKRDHEHDDDDDDETDKQQIALISVFTVVGVLGLLGAIMVLVHVCVKRKREHRAKAEAVTDKEIRENTAEDDELACAWCFISEERLCSWCSGQRTDEVIRDGSTTATTTPRPQYDSGNVSEAGSMSSRNLSSHDDGMVQGKHSFSPRAGIYAISPPPSSYRIDEPMRPAGLDQSAVSGTV